MRKQGIVVLVGAVAMLAAGCDWGQIGFGPRHRSFNPGEVAFTTDNVDELQPDWNAVNVEQGGGLLTWGNHVAVVSTTNGVDPRIVVMAADGSSCPGSVCAIEWRLPAGYGAAAVSGGWMFATTMADATHVRLGAFDASGVQGCAGNPKVCAPVWTATWAAGSVGLPVVGDGRVYVAAGGSTKVFDANLSAGCSAATHTCTPLFELAGATGTVSVADGLAFVATTTDVRVYDATGATCAGTCQPLRRLATGAEPGLPALANGFVYVLTSGGLAVFDAQPPTPCPGSPSTCGPRWTAPVADGFRGGPTVTDSTAFVVAGGELHAFDAHGSDGCSGTPKVCAPVWRGIVPDHSVRYHVVASSSIVFADAQVVSGSDPNVVAFDGAGAVGCSGSPKTCAPLWQSTGAGDTTVTDLIVANGRVMWTYRDFGLTTRALPG